MFVCYVMLIAMHVAIKLFIKYQTLDIEFLVAWLALYSWYKSYIL